MSKAGKNGVTTKTPENIPLGAGTIHKNLKYIDGKWNFANSIVGATSGGSKLSIKPDIINIPIDGVHVAVKNLTEQKQGETAQLEVTWAELSVDIIKAATLVQEVIDGTNVDGYTLLESKPDITEGDYWDNIAFVGKTLKGQNIIIILDNVICTEGFDYEGKDKTPGTLTTVHKCTADLDDDSDYDVLPYHIYYPNAA